METSTLLTGLDRQYHLDCLRIFASFSVMVLHISAQNWYSSDVMSMEWKVFNFYGSIVRWTVPVFVMISGALFLDKEHTVQQLYRKYIFKIVTAYIFWSVAYALLRGLYLRDGIIVFIGRILQGHYHLWFLFMIVGLYILLPILRNIVISKFLTKYFLILTLIFTFRNL